MDLQMSTYLTVWILIPGQEVHLCIFSCGSRDTLNSEEQLGVVTDTFFRYSGQSVTVVTFTQMG